MNVFVGHGYLLFIQIVMDLLLIYLEYCIADGRNSK